jgi:GAF domain-containing protein
MNDAAERIAQAMQEEAFLRSQVAVTHKDYGDAVAHLVGLAQRDTSGSRAAAQVLLSLYNGYNWHVDLVDLGVLDYQYLQSALIAIRGRMTVHEEPHNMIDNGRDIFLALEKDWQHLHVTQRYAEHYKK